MVYKGNENYIFVSYAHADSAKVLPIVDALDKSGFRVWYDSGIEAGTEWPEYIEERLSNAHTVLVFMTPSAVESRNCRNEINFALELKKEMLVVYLEETTLLKGMRLQLNSTQSMFRKNHSSDESFIRELLSARILADCSKGTAAEAPVPEKQPVNTGVRETVISNVCSIGAKNDDDIWPDGIYSTVLNRDESNVVFFHISLLRPIGISGPVVTEKRIYNSANNLVFEDVSEIQMEPTYDKISTGWILRGSNGSFIPSGEYRFVCSINHSAEFTYYFTVTSDQDLRSGKTPAAPAKSAPANRKPLYIMLAAVLLALVVLICVVLFGGKDTKKPYDDQTQPTEFTEPIQLSDEELIVGSWTCSFDLSETIGKQMLDDGMQEEMIPNLPVYLNMEFAFDGEKMEMRATSDEAALTAYMRTMLENALNALRESSGMSQADFEAEMESAYGMPYQEILDEEVKTVVGETSQKLNARTNPVCYRIDTHNSRIYVAEDKAELETTKECMEYKIVDGKLVLEKFYDEDGNVSEAPMSAQNMGMDLPWEFTKK